MKKERVTKKARQFCWLPVIAAVLFGVFLVGLARSVLQVNIFKRGK
jgi:hypothetical protein